MMSSRPRASLDDLRSQEAELRREQKAILLVDHPSSRNKRVRRRGERKEDRGRLGVK